MRGLRGETPLCNGAARDAGPEIIAAGPEVIGDAAVAVGTQPVPFPRDALHSVPVRLLRNRCEHGIDLHAVDGSGDGNRSPPTVLAGLSQAHPLDLDPFDSLVVAEDPTGCGEEFEDDAFGFRIVYLL